MPVSRGIMFMFVQTSLVRRSALAAPPPPATATVPRRQLLRLRKNELMLMGLTHSRYSSRTSFKGDMKRPVPLQGTAQHQGMRPALCVSGVEP
jgi:hypothetical protein